jgi:sugar lactone lactonase YvrE
MSKTAWLLLSLSLIGCGDDGRAKPDGGTDDDADVPNPFTTLATFDPTKGELPEGLVSAGGAVYVGLAPLGQVVKITAPNMVQSFGALPSPVADTYTLGLAANAAGDIFIGVGASGANPTPAPGVYRIPAAGGTAQVFASSPQMMPFPNSIEIDGTTLYVTDSSTGRILEISQNGAVKVWLQDPMLAGNQDACGGSGAPFVIGANGIVRDANNRYVAVTDYGRIVRIPIQSNGMAGTPVVHAESCTDLQGVDGIAIEAAGTIVAVRNGPSLTMSRISADGKQVTPIHVGAPLDGPASVILEGGATPRLVLTNSAFFSGMTGKPSVLALPL